MNSYLHDQVAKARVQELAREALGALTVLLLAGRLRTISATAPAQRRPGAIAAVYVVAYAALSAPSVIAGLAVPRLGIEPTFRIFGAAVIVLALLTVAAAPLEHICNRNCSHC
jgi:hypothetical protein